MGTPGNSAQFRVEPRSALPLSAECRQRTGRRPANGVCVSELEVRGACVARHAFEGGKAHVSVRRGNRRSPRRGNYWEYVLIWIVCGNSSVRNAIHVPALHLC